MAKSDQRTRLTKMLIRKAFTELLREKPVQNIEFQKSLQPLLEGDPSDLTPLNITAGVFACIQQNADVCAIALRPDGDRRFASQLLKIGREQCMASYRKYFSNVSAKKIAYFYAFASSGCIGLLEQWVREDFPGALILRLPALYGRGLKKNFLFDLHTITPAMLRPDKYAALAGKSALVRDGYTLADNGFYKLNGRADPAALRAFFAANDFNALAFTDSRSRYQFYNLGRLWQDITAALDNGLTCLNLTPPPVCAAEVYTAVTGRTGWKNELEKPPFDYDLRSLHAGLLGGGDGYLCTVRQELDDICRFMRDWRD